MMKHRDYMKIALELAEIAGAMGEIPVGAIIVKSGEIIGKGYNLREKEQNSTLHAEVVAINEACKTLNSWRLTDCTMYVTLEPCPMCAGALVNSRISRVVYGTNDYKMGALGGLYNLLNYNVNHKPEILAGILEEECYEVLKAFFLKLR